MKRFFPYILILTIFVQLFAPFALGSGTKNKIEVRVNKAEAADCTIESSGFTPHPYNAQAPAPATLTFNVKTTNCVGKSVTVSIMSYNQGGSHGDVVFTTDQGQILDNDFSFIFKTGENTCNGSSCDNITAKTKIFDPQGTITENIANQQLVYQCTGGVCNDTETWSQNGATNVGQSSNTNCKITKVLFNPMTVISNDRPDEITLWINTSGCQGNLINTKLAVGGLFNDPVLTIPRSTITLDSASYKLKTGEENCSSSSAVCDDIRVKIEIINSVSGETLTVYNSSSTSNNDRVAYKCTSQKNNQKTCDETKKWGFVSSTGGDQTSGGSTTKTVYYFNVTDKNNVVTKSALFNLESDCKKVRDERADQETKNNSGAQVSECTPETITQTTNGIPGNKGELPECSIIFPVKIGGCIAQGIYYLFFKTTSFVFSLAGKILDFTIMYSIQDTSYRSSFVTSGWGVVRDFCNMFFIFVLLYIAIGTILDLHSVKTKEMIINVVIIGLLINFSLFATQVIIDASNILTRVFYNQNTIKTGTKDPNTGEIASGEVGEFGEIKLSEAIVSKVDPQKLIMEAQTVDSIPVRGTVSGEDQDTTSNGVSTGTFILIVLLATAVNVVGIIAFLSSGMIFIARVIGLWIAMILAPIAFFSYIVPSLQDVKMIGWKKWWPETLKLAFLAPVFAFFMYLIVGFMSKGLGVLDVVGKSGLSFVVALVVPFIFIMVLLMKAKDIANDMSGEMGKAITDGAKKFGGVALGAGIGGAAMAMRGTLGRAGSAIANSERVKGWEKKGIIGARTLRNIGNAAGKGSMDLRGVKIAGKGLADTGLKVGKAKEGGFEKMKAEKIEKRVKRAKELELGEGSKEKREANNLEAGIRQKKAEKATDLNKVEKDIATLKERMLNQKAAGLDKDAEETYYELEAKNREKAIIRGGKFTEVKDKTGAVRVAGITTATAGGIADLEDQLNKLNDKINAAEIKSMNEYAAGIESMGNKTINFITSFGQHSGVGANIAADRIRKGVKIEDKTK